jgi:hypothetical protein
MLLYTGWFTQCTSPNVQHSELRNPPNVVHNAFLCNLVGSPNVQHSELRNPPNVVHNAFLCNLVGSPNVQRSELRNPPNVVHNAFLCFFCRLAVSALLLNRLYFLFF